MDLDRGGVAAMVSLTGDETEPSHPPAAAVAGADSSACPRLVLLPRYGKRTDDDSCAVAGAKTTTSAASCTSTGRRFRVSFGLVPSPEVSSFCYAWEEDPDPPAVSLRSQCPIVLAAHGDCVLLEVTTPSSSTSTTTSSSQPPPPPEYFVYQASSGAGRPPSLSLLPPCRLIPTQYHHRRGGASSAELQAKARQMLQGPTGLLRRGEDDVVVAQLERPETEKEAAGELRLLRLRPGRDLLEWQLKRMPIVVVHDGDNDNKGGATTRDDDCRQDHDDGEPLRWWSTDAAFAVGDRFLCWVDYLRGFLFIDMAADDESSLKLRYAPLPAVVVPPPSGGNGNPHANEFGRSNMARTRTLAPAAAGDDGAVRFVDVAARCCCGEPGSTRCERGRFLFTVATWTLKLSMDENEPMEWVKDGVLDCDELWAQPGYAGLPRVTVEYPIVVNSDDPDAVLFFVSTDCGRSYSYSSDDKKVWAIEVDTRRKVLRSVVPYNGSDIHHPRYRFFPAKIQF